jgi:hypothetical protein
MPTTLLTIGPVHVLAEDIIYAMPARSVFLQSDEVLELSLDGTVFVADTTTTTGMQTSAVFVRCTTADAQVVCKAF